MGRRWLIAGVLGICFAGVLVYLLWPRGYCRPARSKYGIVVPLCPDGKLRQTLQITGVGLRRGGSGSVRIKATALYTVGVADQSRQANVPKLDARLSLLDARGKERALPAPATTLARQQQGWQHLGEFSQREVVLPAGLDDGDYLLRARVVTRVGQGVVDLPLALYAPARVHVLTDRPLYEPGHRVQFRALVVRARDLSPIDNRPGRWLIADPRGTVLLEEKAPAGEWGVVAGDFLLDSRAATGKWTVTWSSGSDKGSSSFRVEPFKLPRFRVVATPDRPFYGAGQRPKVDGAVVYSSGAPVQKASVELHWTVGGAWPPPADWKTTALPQKTTTDAAGRFVVQLPRVPYDLQGRVTLSARVSAVDPAGDRVDGAVTVLLGQDALQVAAITPLADGLVSGFNNRMYLRVTTADGRPLPGAQIKVRKAWLGGDEGVVARLDEDSVARIQIDPGLPVNVVIPALPVRKESAAGGPLVERTRALDLISNEEAGLDDQVEMDRWLALVKPCARWRTDDLSEAKLALPVSAGGAMVGGAARGRLGRCALAQIQRRRLPAGKARLYSVTLAVGDPDLPSLNLVVTSALSDDVPAALTELLNVAARDARDCLMKKTSGALPWVLAWRLSPGVKRPAFSWIPAAKDGGKKMPGVDRCILSRLARAELPLPPGEAAMGVVRFSLSQPDGDEVEAAPRPTIMKGYELLVSAQVDGKPVGQTRLRIKPGIIADLTVRAEPVLARPGSEITVRLIRGPKFSGKLPHKIEVQHPGQDAAEIKRTRGKKPVQFTYTIPKNKKGWFTFSALGKHALVFVRDQGDLSVAVTPDRQRYAPGATVRLRVRTTLGQRQARAAVGLFGVDQSLSQLATLVGPDALRILRPVVAMKSKAFGLLDGQALALGRVRGKNAAEATVLRVASVPRPADLDVVVNGTARTRFDPVAELTDRFYLALTELHETTRKWEKSAPASEQMKPETMARLWKEALDSCAARGQRVDDAFGRRLRLHRLPADLLALTDPRQVVMEGTRLPEDVENWSLWVARRKP